jgi:hypothetical protein
MKISLSNFKSFTRKALQKKAVFIAPVLTGLLFIGLTFSSCKKTGPTTAVIRVQDSAGQPAAGASVTLWQDTSTSTQTGQQANIRVTRTTDASGRADFEFALEAYLNIIASKNGDTATGFIRLKVHESTEKTIRIY